VTSETKMQGAAMGDAFPNPSQSTTENLSRIDIKNETKSSNIISVTPRQRNIGRWKVVTTTFLSSERIQYPVEK
jgi:hypothetical protein